MSRCLEAAAECRGRRARGLEQESFMSATVVMVCGWLAGMLPGQPGGGPHVAVINLTAIFERYSMTRDLEQVFGERRTQVTAEAQKRREDLNAKRTGLEQFKPGTTDYRDREESLIKSEMEFQVWLDFEERRLKDEHKRWLQSIYADATAAVAKLAAERGVDLVLTFNALEDDAPDSVAYKQQILLRTVVYANGRADLTEGVVAAMDADYQKRGGPATLQTGPPLPAAKAPPPAPAK